MFLQLLEHPSTLSQKISSFILAADNHAQLIWQLLCLPFVFLILYSAWLNYQGRKQVLGSEGFFLVLTALSLLILRYPALAAGEINPDEAEWIAGAATLIRDPRFWLSVDGTTSGPLNIFPLCVLYFFNLKLSFATTRLFSLIFLLIPSFYFIYFALKNFFNQQVAQVALVPLILLFALTSHFDLSFYSSEYVSVLLLSWVVYLYAAYNKEPETSLLLGAGLLLGLLPYGKMQSLPVGLVLGLFFLIDIISNKSKTAGGKIKAVLLLAISALVPTLITLGYLFYFKAFDDFWQSYILNNVVYGNKVALKNTLLALPRIIFIHSKTTLPYYLAAAIIPVVGIYYLLTNKSQIRSFKWKLFWYFNLVFLASYYAIGKGWGFPHYQLFIFLPLTLLNGYYLQVIKEYRPLHFPKLMLGVYALMAIALLIPDNFLLQKVLVDQVLPPRNPASTHILAYSQPGDKLVVWGFQDILGSNGVYYLETGLIQGTRESHSQRPEGHIGDSAQVRYYQQRFLSDIQKSQPVAIIDLGIIQKNAPSVSGAFYPALGKYIAVNYTLDTVFHRLQTAVGASGMAKVKVRPLATSVYIHKSRLVKDPDKAAGL